VSLQGQPPDDAGPPQPGAEPTGPPVSRVSFLAVISLVLGVLSFVACLSIVAAVPGLVIGIVALALISSSRGTQTGKGLAVSGIVVCALNIILTIVIVTNYDTDKILNWGPGGGIGGARAQARQMACMSNVRQLQLSLMMYTADNGDKFPEASAWCDALTKTGAMVGGPVFQCPEAPALRCAYAFNENLSGLEMDSMPSPGETVLLFESDVGWNAAGGPEAMISTPRHPNGYMIGFVDGHVECVSEEGLEALIWELEQ